MEPIWKVINHTTWRARFDDMIRRDGNRMTPSLVRQVAMAEQWSGADYQTAMFQRADLFRMVQGWFEKADYLVTPTLSRTALPIDQDLFEPIKIDGVEAGELRRNWFPYTMPFNITGHPAITLCCGFDGDGLPIGLQIVGRFRDEASVLRAAALYEASEDWLEPMARPLRLGARDSSRASSPAHAGKIAPLAVARPQRPPAADGRGNPGAACCIATG